MEKGVLYTVYVTRDLSRLDEKIAIREVYLPEQKVCFNFEQEKEHWNAFEADEPRFKDSDASNTDEKDIMVPQSLVERVVALARAHSALKTFDPLQEMLTEEERCWRFRSQ